MKILHLIDSHCHLNLPEYDEVLDDILASAKEVGVQQCIVPGTDLASSARAVRLAETNPELYAAVGIHPHEARHWTDEYYFQLKELARSPRVVAIGEIGLDYHYNHSPQEIQKDVLRSQLSLAIDLHLPMIIHNRESNTDLISILTSMDFVSPAGSNRPSGVLHAFSGDRDTAEKALQRHFLLGIAGPVTYKNADTLRETLLNFPLESYVIETDSPFMAPHPHRGKRNQPGWVYHVAEMLANLFHTTIEEVAEVTTKNSKRLFGLTDGKYTQ